MVNISICGMCKHYTGDLSEHKCPAFPGGRRHDAFFPVVNKECGEGYRFEPKEECSHLWDEKMYKKFSA